MKLEDFFGLLAIVVIMFLFFLCISKATDSKNFKYTIRNINTSYHTNSYSFDDKDNIIFVDEDNRQMIVTKPYSISETTR